MIWDFSERFPLDPNAPQSPSDRASRPRPAIEAPATAMQHGVIASRPRTRQLSTGARVDATTAFLGPAPSSGWKGVIGWGRRLVSKVAGLSAAAGVR